MDPGAVGALIGIGVMVCIVCTGVLHEKGSELLRKARTSFQKYKQQKQPLLVVTKDNPVLVRSGLNQWKMRELLVLK